MSTGFSFGSFGKPTEKKDETLSQPSGFSFGALNNASNTSSKFAFGSVTPAADENNSDNRKTPFLFGNKSETAKPDNKQSLLTETKSEETDLNKQLKTKTNEQETDLLKSYQLPSFNHLIDEKDMDVDDTADGDAFFDIDFDHKTNLPIRRLEFDDTQKSLLNKNTHLNFAISNKTETGVVFATPNTEKKDDDATSKLFPFDLVPKSDGSLEYNEFLKNIYKDMEFLLKDKKYQNYMKPNNSDDYMEIGVVSTIKQAESEQSFHLSQTMSFVLNHLKALINQKLHHDLRFEDQWVVNYENIINVLYLMNALHFGEEDETIILFQQWAERIDIQLDTKILNDLLEDPEKPCLNPTFWSVYMKKLLLRGSFSIIEEDFKVSQYEELKDTDFNLYTIMDEFYNLITSYDSIEFSKSTTSFLQWKKKAVNLREEARNIETSNLSILSEIIPLLNIISGSVHSIEENCSKWYENFMGRFLYQMPSKKLVNEYITQTLQLDSLDLPIEGIDSWDSICVELFKGKFLTVISSIESLDKSIGTYVAVLLEASGLLTKYYNDLNVNNTIDKVETKNNITSNINRMVEDLALTYLNTQDLFAIGVGILINVGSNKSREILSELLPTYEIKDSDDFEWVLSVCSELKLKKTMSTIQQIQGEKLYEKQLIGNALTCFAESESIDKVVSIVWRIFEETLINGGLDEKLAVQLFENDTVNNNAILRQSLSPVYILDKILRNDSRYDDVWFDRLITLFTFKYLNGYYKPGLLMIILRTLNNGIYDYEKLLKLIEAINDYETELENNADVNEKSEQLYSLLVKQDIEAGNTPHQPPQHPSSVKELLVAVRRGIALDITFTFLE